MQAKTACYGRFFYGEKVLFKSGKKGRKNDCVTNMSHPKSRKISIPLGKPASRKLQIYAPSH